MVAYRKSYRWTTRWEANEPPAWQEEATVLSNTRRGWVILGFVPLDSSLTLGTEGQVDKVGRGRAPETGGVGKVWQRTLCPRTATPPSRLTPGT